MILADTSVWVDHLRAGDELLAWHLERGELLMHPFVLGELACGNLPRRAELLVLLHQLPRCPPATDKEVMRFIERHRLMGQGIGWVDAHLLASLALSGERCLWTRDRRLAEAVASLGYAARPDDPRGNLHEPRGAP